MNSRQRELFTYHFRRLAKAEKFPLFNDDDGFSWWMKLCQWLLSLLAAVVLFLAMGLMGVAAGSLFGSPGLGLVLGFGSAVFGLWAFVRRPSLSPPNQALDDRAAHDGTPSYHDQLDHSFRRAWHLWIHVGSGAAVFAVFAALVGWHVVIWAKLGALVLFGWSVVDVIDPNLEAYTPPDHQNVEGDAAVANDLPTIVQAGLTINGTGGFFIGTHEVWL